METDLSDRPVAAAAEGATVIGPVAADRSPASERAGSCRMTGRESVVVGPEMEGGRGSGRDRQPPAHTHAPELGNPS